MKKGEKVSLVTPYKASAFDTYVLWKSIPAFIKNPPTRTSGIRVSVANFCKEMEIDDEEIISLAEIKSQTHFAQHFNIHINTLTDWNKVIIQRDLLKDTKRWASRFSRNVLMALYHKALETGDAVRVKLWFQLVEGFNDKRASYETTPAAPIDFVIVDSSTSGAVDIA